MKRTATTLLIAALLATPILSLPPPAQAQVGVSFSVSTAPPPLPAYAQPVVPGPGYVWIPGYWAWEPSFGYYWVPGTWVLPPEVGLLWTPGWWGWSDGAFVWNAGYWGPRVGYYGGINYGYGYYGRGYVGGYWRNNQFFYNRAVNNINVNNVHNVYVDQAVINNVHVNRVSYNGGQGGLSVQPTSAQRTYARQQRRFAPTTMQTRQREAAIIQPTQRARTGQGRPAVFATQHPGHFDGPHAVRKSAAANSRMTAPKGKHPNASPSNPPEKPHKDHSG